MDRQKMRSILRRRLQETDPERWEDDDLNELLNVGLQRMQSAIMRQDPEAFISIATADVVAVVTLANRFYAFPPAFWYEVLVELKGSASSEYRQLERKTYRQTLITTDGATDPFYARMGQAFVLAPPPSAAVAAGLRLTFVNTLALNSDAETPDIPKALHFGAVLYAHLFALPEGGEAAAQDSVLKEIGIVLAEIPLVYTKAAGGADYLQPTVEQDY